MDTTKHDHPDRPFVFSIIIPCYNEEATLKDCVDMVLAVDFGRLSLELVIVDDGSTDASLDVAHSLEKADSRIRVIAHEKNQGKGAALRTGFTAATGDFIGVQDADREYDPSELPMLLEPLIKGEADVVLGSRYLKRTSRRVLFFWHTLMNKSLTFLSNLFTDLDLTDMETCYKLFRAEVIKGIDIRENRFGFEPEIVAKVAQQRLRIHEIGITYHPRSVAQGKKINWKDGVRALYCIMRYNAHKAPLPLQLLIYLFIGGFSALCNLALFSLFLSQGLGVTVSAATAFGLAACINYGLCVLFLFRHKARWSAPGELFFYILVVAVAGAVDVGITTGLAVLGVSALLAKSVACLVGLALNFIGRRNLVFYEPPAGPWEP